MTTLVPIMGINREGTFITPTHTHTLIPPPTHTHTPAHYTGGGGPQKLVHMLHSSEYPLTTFAVLDSNKCLVAENTLDTIFLHLRQFYAQRKGHKVDVKGVHYDLNDKYIVKVGSVVIGSSNKGIIVEVRIQPSCTLLL